MNALWTADDFLAAIGGWPAGAVPQHGIGDISGISIDSRTIAGGDAFFAIRGDRFDGHDFVEAALRNGAAAAIVHGDRIDGIDGSAGPLLLVEDDPLDALNRLAAASRKRSGAQVIAVTGSVGKTGTKEMLRTALSAVGPTHAPVGSYNNHWGVPLTLARMPADCRFGIFEIGMNHPGEIAPLSRLVRPDIAIITTIARAHMASFTDEGGIAAAKAEIFEGLASGGTAVLNRDNRWFDDLAARAAAAGASVRSFGSGEGADVRLAGYRPATTGSRIDAVADGRAVSYELGAAGRHMALNSLAVLAAIGVLGGMAAPEDQTRAMAALGAFRALEGRGAQMTLGGEDGVLLIDESYNANPDSMTAALALLGDARPRGAGRRIAVLGDMLELGAVADAAHAALLEPLLRAGVDRVFLAGPHMKSLWKVLPEDRRGAYADTAKALEPILFSALGCGDVVMVKGSLGSKLGPLVIALKQTFADGPPRGAGAKPVRTGG